MRPLLIAATALLLAACSSAPVAPGAVALADANAAQTAKTADGGRETITGSRIPARSTDRMVKSIGAEAAQQMQRDRPGFSGAPSR